MRGKCTPPTCSSPGYRVAEATNGIEAIEQARDLMPDIILMDLALPKMDGWEATRRLKRGVRTRDIPIVALTGHALAGHAEGARQAGCDAFVTKPCLPDALVAEIKRMLASRDRATDTGARRRRPQTDGKKDAEEAKTARRRPNEGQGSPAQASATCESQRPLDPRRARQARTRQDARGGSRRTARDGESPPTRRTRASTCTASSNRSVRCRSGRWGSVPNRPRCRRCIYRDIAAVVSNTPMVVQDPTRDNVLAHQRVNETVMQQHTVIPMSFGTVFKTDDDIMELLRSAYDAFTDVLNKMQDKFEFGLKVLWDRDQIIREIEEEDEDIRRLKGEISSQKGSTYFARMQYGRLIDAALQARSERYVAEIFEALRDVSVASRSNKPIGDRMIMNAAFLVARDTEQAFDARVKDIGSRYDKLTFKYTGPWPPYNFVNIRLKLERAH